MSAPAPDFALQLAHVARKFGPQFVLRDVSLDVRPGEVLALYGGNGAGKTTLLRVVAGLLSPSRGEGRVFGYDLKDKRSVRELVFFMTEGGGLYADLTAAENLDFTARMYGLAPHSAELLGRVGLTAAAGKRARDLSSGMRKRLQLARMLLAPSPLLLLDEPFANLDAGGKEAVLTHLRAAQGEGKTILFSSHEPELAAQVATRTLTLNDGVLA
ncbi:heme ABC exporter ATP-binding protein CcmA [Deinococcus wulumuqiensis]|uniref:Heme ABC exporter ATP-binding protein CcmA n=1 Tax=Deinococcus wulumuqiensis TaxID=980427 RepID=A0AAV4K8S7_9DEIO|nr:heme ABC exporter ATP-binding protein CcmA [Deinococcus wulumuqiensis]QII20985.1 heme ABC exporter ATP-binding protein CcmA [Deinococcus wulumuqiensis R12]GGI79721.1 heme ABC exporter ATP-binding protein CcmA [Deinococcus wulumuqiensis]GGP28990.1 heme ABC exporter ATP-binding protein CcmA [Deinococcus wulumuqiensis]